MINLFVTQHKNVIENFKNISKDIDFLLYKTTDMLLDAYKGTPAEISALKYLERIKSLSEEVNCKINEVELNQSQESIKILDKIQHLIEQRNNLLKRLGVVV